MTKIVPTLILSPRFIINTAPGIVDVSRSQRKTINVGGNVHFLPPVFILYRWGTDWVRENSIVSTVDPRFSDTKFSDNA